jgi:DNA-directed RNA polymerase specialized sigma subunit
MLSVLPTSQREPSDPPALLTLDQAALLDVADPWRRSQLADELVKQLRALASVVLQIRSEAVRELVHQHGAPRSRVARHLGVSRARVSQLVSAPAASDPAEAVA